MDQGSEGMRYLTPLIFRSLNVGVVELNSGSPSVIQL